MTDSLSSAQRRERVIARAKGCCEYCLSQSRFSPDPFSIEHIVPLARGGSDNLANLALACQGCNNRKYTRLDAIDPVSGARTGLFHPRLDHWAEHFAWNESFALVVGLTPTARATIALLELNREGVVNLRRVLAAAGFHPPP